MDAVRKCQRWFVQSPARVDNLRAVGARVIQTNEGIGNQAAGWACKFARHDLNAPGDSNHPNTIVAVCPNDSGNSRSMTVVVVRIIRTGKRVDSMTAIIWIRPDIG